MYVSFSSFPPWKKKIKLFSPSTEIIVKPGLQWAHNCAKWGQTTLTAAPPLSPVSYPFLLLDPPPKKKPISAWYNKGLPLTSCHQRLEMCFAMARRCLSCCATFWSSQWPVPSRVDSMTGSTIWSRIRQLPQNQWTGAHLQSSTEQLKQPLTRENSPSICRMTNPYLMLLTHNYPRPTAYPLLCRSIMSLLPRAVASTLPCQTTMPIPNAPHVPSLPPHIDFLLDQILSNHNRPQWFLAGTRICWHQYFLISVTLSDLFYCVASSRYVYSQLVRRRTTMVSLCGHNNRTLHLWASIYCRFSLLCNQQWWLTAAGGWSYVAHECYNSLFLNNFHKHYQVYNKDTGKKTFFYRVSVPSIPRCIAFAGSALYLTFTVWCYATLNTPILYSILRLWNNTLKWVSGR